MRQPSTSPPGNGRTTKRNRTPKIFARTFYPFLKQAGLPRIRFHDLRHTAATLRQHQGDHPKVVQELLGHSRVSVILDTYSHVMPTLWEESLAKIDPTVGGPRLVALVWL